MSLWKWNDVELEVDLNDVEFLVKYEDAFNKLGEQEEQLKKVGKSSELAIGYCSMFYDLFDNIFGKETGEQLLGKKMNMAVCDECYESFINFCSKQASEICKNKAKKLEKYIPKKR